MTERLPSPARWTRSVAGIVNVAVPHNEPPASVRRRRIVVAIVLLLGAAALGLALRRHPGESSFYWLVAGAGGGVGARGVRLRAVASRRRPLAWSQPAPGGQRHRDRPAARRRLRARRVDRPRDPGRRRADHPPAALHATRDRGGSPWPSRCSAAIAEELFYRGALYTALGRHHPLLISTVDVRGRDAGQCRNPMLAFAAIILGTVCALERRATGGVLAPILTHFVWTLVVLLALPPLFGL